MRGRLVGDAQSVRLATRQGLYYVGRAAEARLSRAGPAYRWAGNPLGRQSGLDLLSDLALLNIPNPKLPCRPHLAGRTLQAAPWQQLDFLFAEVYF